MASATSKLFPGEPAVQIISVSGKEWRKRSLYLTLDTHNLGTANLPYSSCDQAASMKVLEMLEK